MLQSKIVKVLLNEDIPEKHIIQICKDFSGCKVYIPKNIYEHHIFKKYGTDICRALLKHYVGKCAYFPIYKENKVSKSCFRGIIISRLFSYIQRKVHR